MANAKLAYQSFQRLFAGERWQALEGKGARVQRPLWASTSTKDPLYRDVCYVEPLIGPHTVNTMPDETIEAFADHGVIKEFSVAADLDAAAQVLRDVAAAGIDMDCVTEQLLHEGVQKFLEPFDMLMRTLANKRQAILGERAGSQTMALGQLKSVVGSAYKALDNRQFSRRLWAHDALLWKDDAAQVAAIQQRLGWLDSVDTFRGHVEP